jgi:hypothetical protein
MASVDDKLFISKQALPEDMEIYMADEQPLGVSGRTFYPRLGNVELLFV